MPDSLLASWVARIDNVLAQILTPGEPVALVNFPNHGNAGDDALWLGAHAALRRLGCAVVYECTPPSFSHQALAGAHPEGPVLLNGGGNFGDLFAPQQQLREHLLAELRDRRLIQLPQSIHFRDDRNFERVRRLVAAHGNFTLLLREQPSFEIASRFQCPRLLCPDLALSLGALSRPVAASQPLLWLQRHRGSPEYRDPGPVPAAVEPVEWLASLPDDEASWDDQLSSCLALNRQLTAQLAMDPESAETQWSTLAATFKPLATAWMDRGLRLLSRGEVVVTERLHGHLLCVQLGIPHVVLDNAYGKCRATWDTWTSAHPLAHWADSAAEAYEIARSL